jgi:RNA polymerase sigma factor (sigma-70 family)
MEPLLTLIRHMAPDGRPDADLIAAFLFDQDERAFAEVVRRHGPVVWGACRRLLPDPGDAEDAFQASFLVLVRRGYRTPTPLGPWLYRVAVLTARGVRRRNARRLARTRPLPEEAAARPAPAPAELDGLLLRLPEKYRAAVVLCYLDGLTEPEAADRLGCPVGTLSARLSRGLARLRAWAGVDPRVILAAAAWAVPAAAAAAAVRTAVVVRVSAEAVGAVPDTVSSLAEGVARMLWLRAAARAVAGLAAAVGVGLVALAGTPPRAQPADPQAAQPADPPRAPPQPAVVPIGEREGLDVVGPPEDGEAVWKAGFRAAYQLTPGKAIGFVKGDPFPDARRAYMRVAHPSFDPDGREFLHTLVTDGRRLVGWGANGTYGREPVRNPLTGAVEQRLRGRPLWLILQRLGMKPVPVFDGDPDLLGTELHADTVVREGATLQDLARDLPAALRVSFGVAVTVVTRLEERPVSVVRGKFAPTADGEAMIDIAAGPLGAARPDTVYTHNTFFRNELFDYLTAALGGPVLDETDADSWGERLKGYRYIHRAVEDARPKDLSADRGAVLKHVAAQTGLTVTSDTRKVWVLSVKKADE